MQAIQKTVHELPRLPGHSGAGCVCTSVQKQLTRMTVSVGVRCLAIANEQFKSYESDLGMT
jgi:hypothetical protein